jgi:hypothetical protein
MDETGKDRYAIRYYAQNEKQLAYQEIVYAHGPADAIAVSDAKFKGKRRPIPKSAIGRRAELEPLATISRSGRRIPNGI